MNELSKGGNAPLGSGDVVIAVTGTQHGSVDLMVLQLTGDRRVRHDDDFVFYNQPTSPEGAVRLDGDRISVDLAAVPAAIERLAVAVALDDSVTGALSSQAALAVTLEAGADAFLARAAGFTTERAAVLVEVYRHGGGWKVRNVSAGWDAGLAALAREHGVTVDDAATPSGAGSVSETSHASTVSAAPQTAMAMPPSSTSGASHEAPTQEPPTHEPLTHRPPAHEPADTAPSASQFAPPAGAQIFGGYPGAPAPSAHAGGSSVPSSPGATPEAATHRSPPTLSAPPATPSSSAPAPASSAAPTPNTAPTTPGAPVDLGKRTGAISLQKGQRVSIEKTPLIRARIEWPAATDYDVFALIRYADGHDETVAAFGTTARKSFSLRSSDGAVTHLGDVGRAQQPAPRGFFARRQPAAAAPMASETIEIRLTPSVAAVVPVVYSAQSNGTGSFRRYQVTMSIDNGQGTSVRIEARNASADDRVYSCVPGIVVNRPDGVIVDSLELYSAPGSENRPIIDPQLRVVMDAGARNLYK